MKKEEKDLILIFLIFFAIFFRKNNAAEFICLEK